uniref:Multidrug-efflux transporter n=1 Tax=Candidatus Kentrum sp. DK TaxID=2126562 RepID=A0A450S3C5_9GAMM|nr:MAG: multidrug resistance protein, MATE family [Candidatus Kentron sp. DK]
MARSGFPTASDLLATLKISLRLSIGYLGGIAIGATDNIMLGHLGHDALGAAGLASSIYNPIVMMGIGMTFPVMVFISQARGAGRSRTAPRIIRQGLWISGMLSVPSLAVLWNLESILLLTGQDPTLARMADHYMDYYMWTIFPIFTSYMFIYAFTGMDRTTTIILILWSEVGLNAVLNYVLIFGKFGFPAMGMAGAGLASIIVYAAGHTAFFSILAFHRFFRNVVVFRRVWRPKWTMLGQFLRLGWPKSFELLLKSSLYAVMALLAGRFDVEALASHTIAHQISMIFTVTVSIAVANAVATRTGVAKGQGSLDGIWGILNGGLLLILLFILPLIAVLKIFSPWVVMLFVGSGLDARALLPIASPLVVLVAFFVLMDGLRMVVGQALNGLSDIKTPTLIAAISYWGIALPVGVVLGFVMELGVLGLWWGLIFGMAVAAVACLARFRWVIRHFSSVAKGG